MKRLLIAELAKIQGLTEIDFLKKYLDESNDDIVNTASKLGVSVSCIRKAMIRTGLHTQRIRMSSLHRLYQRNYTSASDNLTYQCAKLRLNNPRISFTAFRNIISRIIEEERKNANT